MSKSHLFIVEEAEMYGVGEAILLNNIRFWLDKNVSNDKNFKKGRYWTYNSYKAFSELFPYYTAKQIRTRLNKLESLGLLIVDSFNDYAPDKTNWYSINEEEYVKKEGSAREGKGCAREGKGSAHKGKPIPYVNTDINTDILKPCSKSENDFSREVFETYEICLGFFPEHLHPKNPNDWLEVIDKLHRLDQIPLETVCYLVEAVRKDAFWSKNFLTLKKLRKKNKDGIPYIVVFAEKFKPKEPTVGRQTLTDLEANSKGW